MNLNDFLRYAEEFHPDYGISHTREAYRFQDPLRGVVPIGASTATPMDLRSHQKLPELIRSRQTAQQGMQRPYDLPRELQQSRKEQSDALDSIISSLGGFGGR